MLFAWRSFEAYPIVASVAGATSVRVPLTSDGRHDLTALAAAVTDRTRLIFVCSPNNPTGTAVTQAELDEFMSAVPSDVMVVFDEAYIEFCLDPAAADGLATYRHHSNLAVLRTFSKAYGLAGLRVGYAIAQPPVIEALNKTALPFGVSIIAQSRGRCVARGRWRTARSGRRTRRGAHTHDRRPARPRVDVVDSEANFIWLHLGEQAAAFAEHCEAAGLYSSRISWRGGSSHSW